MVEDKYVFLKYVLPIFSAQNEAIRIVMSDVVEWLAPSLSGS